MSEAPQRKQSPSREEELKEATKKLDELSLLEENWDSYGAEPITPDAIDAAYQFMAKHLEESSAFPHEIMPDVTGGVVLAWQTKEPDDVALYFKPDGSLELYVHDYFNRR